MLKVLFRAILILTIILSLGMIGVKAALQTDWFWESFLPQQFNARLPEIKIKHVKIASRNLSSLVTIWDSMKK